MRLEILIDNSEPQIYPLNKPKILIGSHESCDIVIEAVGVSRKHIAVLTENDNYYIIDQGSANGTYINDERLVPGNRVEFTSFFPVRISGNVLITLLSDGEADDLGLSKLDSFVKQELSKPTKTKTTPSSSLQDATKAISLKDLQQTRTESLIKKRSDLAQKKRAEVPSKKMDDNKRMKVVFLVCLVAVGVASYWNLFLRPPEQPVDQLESSKNEAQKKDVPTPEPTRPVFKLVDESSLLPVEKYPEILKNMPCTTDVEKYFCDKIKSVERFSVQVGTSLFVFFDGTDFITKARSSLPDVVSVDQTNIEKYYKDLLYVASLLYFFEQFPRDLDYNLFKDLNLIFVMKVKLQDGNYIYSTLAFHPESLEKFLSALDQRYFKASRKFGIEALALFKEYFRYY